MAEAKYITVNGVMKKNPKYVPQDSSQTTIPTATPVTDIQQAPLAVVSSVVDVMDASEVQEQSNGHPVLLAESTSETIAMLQDADILAQYNSRTPVDGGELLDKLGEIFSQYETPLGMVNKLMMLTGYQLDFIIDDSLSMSAPTDVDMLQATEPMQTHIRNKLNRAPRPGEKMTRLQEAEDRLHIMISILAYIPVEHIRIRFLNNQTPIILKRDGKTPDEFKDAAHQEIQQRFSQLHLASTPVRAALEEGFKASGKWCHYLFNDGEPNEGGPAIAAQIKGRSHPENHIMTLISCTNRDAETEWMKQVDAEAQYVAEVDDFEDEKTEVMKKQGSAFPFTRGLWILCQLVAALNPYDLDALDEGLPLTKSTLDNLLGRQLSPEEYQYYFDRNPNAALYRNEYTRFLNDSVFARQLIPTVEQTRRERAAGYINGEPPRTTASVTAAPSAAFLGSARSNTTAPTASSIFGFGHG